MKIAIGSDKSGFAAKEAIKAWLTKLLPWYRKVNMKKRY